MKKEVFWLGLRSALLSCKSAQSYVLDGDLTSFDSEYFKGPENPSKIQSKWSFSLYLPSNTSKSMKKEVFWRSFSGPL
jgi:hypothetical protein